MSRIPSASDILKLKGKRRIVPLPCAARFDLAGWHIRSLSERERAEYESKLLDARGHHDPARLKVARVRLMQATICDSTGILLLSDTPVDDILDIDCGVTTAIAADVQKHVGFDEGDIEKLLGNSEPTGDAA